jgi:hypothetical protein
MKGPKVNKWVQNTHQLKNERINQGINARGGDTLWAWFKNLFRLAFTDTTKREDELTKLLTL